MPIPVKKAKLEIPFHRQEPDNMREPINAVNELAEKLRNVKNEKPPQINLIREKKRILPIPEGQVLDTVGIELESLGKTRRDVSNILSILPPELGRNFEVHRDGSSEMRIYYVNTNKRKIIPISQHTPEAEKLFKNRNVDTSGYELVSVPMDIDSAELTLWSLLPLLESNGDFISERCATHVHVGMAKNLQMMKNILKLGLWADELFYAISGMGGRFRGYSNNAIYARPLINGPYFPYGDYYYQTLNWKKALDMNDMYSFFACYALDLRGNQPKYHPARYFSINIYSILLHNTIEFRHFNQSFNPTLITAIVKLCQLFAEICIKTNWSYIKSLEPGNVFETNSTSYYIEKLHKLLYLGKINYCKYGLNSEDINSLERVIDLYRGIGLQDIPVMTHVKEMDVNADIIELGGLSKMSKRPIPAGQVDIHNIKYQSIMNK